MNKSFDWYLGHLIFTLTVFSYFQFFSFLFIPYTIRIMAQVFLCLLMIIMIIIKIIYQREERIKMNFAGPVLFLILGSIPCYFIAKSYHGQNFLVSAYANRLIGFYFLYFFAHYYKIDVKYVIRLLVIIGLISVGLYYLQFTLYPKKIMDINIMEGRGTIRLFVGGMICAQMAYFYFLNQFFAKNKPLYLLLSLLTMSIFILQGTRQLILALVFLTLVNLLFARKIHGRFLIAVVSGMAVCASFFVFREIFIELTRVSSTQMQNLGGGIRIKAARFFLTSFMPGKLAYLFGNSSSGLASPYDQRIMYYAVKFGFYTADIGIVGDYVKYGLIFTIAAIVLLVKSLRFKISPKFSFFKYYILSQCFTLLTGFGVFGGVDVVWVLSLYIFDKNRAELLYAKKHNKSIGNRSPELKVPDSNK